MHDALACVCLAMYHCSILRVMQGDDIPVDLSGDWRLGNLESVVVVGTLVQSHTHWCRQEKLIGQPGKARYGWYMQAAGLAVQLQKTDWKEKLTVDGHCLTPKVVAAIREVQTESLLDLSQKNLRRAQLWFCLSGLAS